ncbi:MAG: 2-oxoacid:acceptor oxidoreductase family protein [Desulfobacterales bacterium]
MQNVDVTRGLKPGGWILLNSPEPLQRMDAFAGYRLAFVDATQIAVQYDLGTRTHPIINTAMIGAFARMMGMPPSDPFMTKRPHPAAQPARQARTSHALKCFCPGI